MKIQTKKHRNVRTSSTAKHQLPVSKDCVEDDLVTKELIETRAYQLWLQRNSPQGSDWCDWFQAKEELLHLGKERLLTTKTTC